MASLKNRRFEVSIPFLAKAADGPAFEEAPDGGLFIEGIASAEMEDTQRDIMKWDGIKKAFAGWQGNVIVEHPKTPADKTVGTRISATFDEEKKQVGVRAYISKSAVDAQTKIREGVLKAFSVQGEINDTPDAFRFVTKSDGRKVREVNDWRMSALAVVGAAALGPTAHFRIAKEDTPQEPEPIEVNPYSIDADDLESPSIARLDRIEKSVESLNAGLEALQKTAQTPPPISLTPEAGKFLAKSVAAGVAGLFDGFSEEIRGVVTAQAGRIKDLESTIKSFGQRVPPGGPQGKTDEIIKSINGDANRAPVETSLREALKQLKRAAKTGETVTSLLERYGVD